MNWSDRFLTALVGVAVTVISTLVLFGLAEKLTIRNPSEAGSGDNELLMFIFTSPLVLPGCIFLGILIGASAALFYYRLFRRTEAGGAQNLMSSNPRRSIAASAPTPGPHERSLASRAKFAAIAFSFLTFLFLPWATREKLYFWLVASFVFVIGVGQLLTLLKKDRT